MNTNVRRVAPPGWWLLLCLAVIISGYALSFTVRGIDAFGAPLLASFSQRPWAIWAHIVFGSIALVTGVLNFRHAIRRRYPAVHRRLGQGYVLSSLLTAVAGGWLAVFAYGGLPNRLGFGGLAIATLLTTAMAYREARARRFPTHRAWMIRSYAMILAGVSLRLQAPFLVMGLGSFDAGYAVVAWTCWIPNVVLAEIIVRRTTRPSLA